MGFGNPKAERVAIETTYEDTATVFRQQPRMGEYNITTVRNRVIYSDVICALSYTGSDSSGQTRAQNNIDYDAVVFMPPELDVMPGDRIELKRFGADDPDSSAVLKFEVVGRPAVYATHQQIRVKDRDIA